MMVETKKAEIQNMRYNLSFRNENQLNILDNHLSSISNVSSFSAKFKVFDAQGTHN